MLITEEYRELNKQLHAGNKEYGVTSKYYANDILDMCNSINDQDVLD